MLHGLDVPMSRKPFSIGARIEHPPDDGRPAPSTARRPVIRPCGAADYKPERPSAQRPRGLHLLHVPRRHGGGRGQRGRAAWSTNGMSYFARDGENANSRAADLRRARGLRRRRPAGRRALPASNGSRRPSPLGGGDYSRARPDASATSSPVARPSMGPGDSAPELPPRRDAATSLARMPARTP